MFQACTSQTWTKLGSSFVIQSANCAISKNLSSSCKSVARIQSAFEISPRNPPSATVVNARTGGAFFRGSTRVNPNFSRSTFSDSCNCEAPTSSTAASSSKRIFFSRELIPPTSLRPLRRGEFPSVEDQNATHRHNSAKKQNDLTKCLTQLRPRDT